MQTQLIGRNRESGEKKEFRHRETPAIPELHGLRLADLSTNLISFASQLLSGRFSDARWWAGEPAIRAAITDPSPARRTAASERLIELQRGRDLYFDIWIADATGLVIAQAKPGGYCYLRKTSVAGEAWFRDAMDGRQRSFFHGISRPEIFVGHTVATYSASIREGNLHEGKVIGALGLFVDWQLQAEKLVNGVRIPPDERDLTRTMILDASNRIVASSGQRGVLSERFPLHVGNAMAGHYEDHQGHVVGHARPVGGEPAFTGWHAVIEQSTRIADRAPHVAARGFGAGHMIVVRK